MNQRAYSTIDCKAFEDASGKRTFKGTASTPSVDRTQDILVSTGATFKLPIPLLWAHDSTQPIGWITSAKVTAKGIDVECEVANVTEPGRLKDRLDEAWQSLKALLVRGLSVGFRPIDVEQIEGSWGRLYKAWEILEVSAVVVPCNADCNIQTVKSIDTATRSALGLTRKGVVRLTNTPNGVLKPKADPPDPLAATGPKRKGIVRLADPPGASGLSKRQPA